MNKIYNIGIVSDIDLSVYLNNNLIKYMNEYNKLSFDNIDMLKELLKRDYFLVPSKMYEQPWGKEKVFLPFTTKLFKVLETSISDTSIQLHPMKTEKYLSLSNNTFLTNSNKTICCKRGKLINIPKNSIHSLLKNSRVFEDQDNLIFDNKETVRLNDVLKRKVSTPQEYIKYLLPQFLNNFKFEKLKNYNGNSNKFVFISEGEVEIEVDGIKTILSDSDELYYLDRRVKINRISGLVRVIECKYYRIS